MQKYKKNPHRDKICLRVRIFSVYYGWLRMQLCVCYSMTFLMVSPAITTYMPLARVTVVDSAAVVVYTN